MQYDIESIYKIVNELIEKLSRVSYGEASLIFRVHEKNLVSITHSLTENTRNQIQLPKGLEDAANQGDKA
jgi:hypothetical protein